MTLVSKYKGLGEKGQIWAGPSPPPVVAESRTLIILGLLKD